MSISFVAVPRPDLGGWARECENCHGEGYVQVGSTTDPEENDLELCGECEGSGVVDTYQDNEDYIHNGDN